MNKVLKIKKEKSLESTISKSSINFKDFEQGIDILAFSSAIRAMGLSNRDTQPKKLSNYIRSGYLQIQLICSVILFQLRGDKVVSRDDLYDSICEVFPMTTYSNFRKVLSSGVDSERINREVVTGNAVGSHTDGAIIVCSFTQGIEGYSIIIITDSRSVVITVAVPAVVDRP